MAQAYESPRLAGVYHHGNEMPPESLSAWVDLILGYAPVPRPRIVDIGAGTGMFAAALAARAVAGVVGVEPSVVMREQARRHSAGAGNVEYVAGDAASIPVPDGSVDLVLASRMVHHVPDRVAFVRESARVLAPGGVVVVRTTFRERLDALVYEYWPGLRDWDRGRFVGAAELVGEFEAGGFGIADVVSFAQPVAGSLAEYRDRLAARPQSKFAHLGAEEFQAGLAVMGRDAGAAVDVAGGPVLERYDVLVAVRG